MAEEVVQQKPTDNSSGVVNLKSRLKSFITTYKKTLGMLLIGALLIGLPVTVTLIGQQQDIRQRAAGGDQVIDRLVFSPGAIQLTAEDARNQKRVPMSVLAYDSNNKPLLDYITYEWGISSSSSSAGTLESVSGSIATFVAKNVGRGDIFVTAKIGPQSKTQSIPVTLGNVVQVTQIPPSPISSPSAKPTQPPMLSGQYKVVFSCVTGCQGDYTHTMNITAIDGDVFSGTGYYDADRNVNWTITGHVRPNGTITYNLVYTGVAAGYSATGNGQHNSNNTWSGTDARTSQNQTTNWKFTPIPTLVAVTTFPSPTKQPALCKTGINSYTLYAGNCTGNTYVSATIQCYDGYQTAVSSAPECLTTEALLNMGIRVCSGRNSCMSSPTPPQPTKIPVPTKIANRAPLLKSATIDSTIKADGKTPYKLSVTAHDDDGGNDITNEFALINYQGANAGQYRGLIGWSSTDFIRYWNKALKVGSPIKCSGGGQAAIYNGYGAEYINLVDCGTTVSGGTRTTTFLVTFNANFSTPTLNNTISAFADDQAGLYNGWLAFGTFNLAKNQKPTFNSASIDTKMVKTNGTRYKIAVTATDPDGGADVTREFALIDYGSSEGPRGYIGWSSLGFEKYWGNNYKPGTTPLRCFLPSGGGNYPAGAAAIYNGYGAEYVNLHACYTTVSGNTRTTTFDVSFNSNFKTPVSNNSIWGFVEDTTDLYNGWLVSGNFSLENSNKVPKLSSIYIQPQIRVGLKNQYKIEITTSDENGGEDIADQYMFINLEGQNGGQYRGYLGWSSLGFRYWGNLFKKPGPVKCSAMGVAQQSVDGQAAVFGAYGQEYIDVHSCGTFVRGNIRTTTLVVSFSPNFTTPLINTISGFTDDKAGLYDYWRPLATFNIVK